MASDALGCDEDAEGVLRSDDQTADGSCLGSAQDVGKFGEPLVLVDGGALVGIEPASGEVEDRAGEVVEPAAYFLVEVSVVT